MQSAIFYLLTIAAIVLAVPVAVLLIEVASFIARPQTNESLLDNIYPRIAVLVPAHNESDGIISTVSDILAQLRPNDRLLVVADNCSDDTAVVATTAGAEVVERFNELRIGKGYALDFGILHLSHDPPEILVVIDADCRLGENAIARLSSLCQRSGRPCQALDLMMAPMQSKANFRVAEFAWRVKNWVRPTGLKNLSLPCQLMGTGMAFPWPVIRSIEVASGRIVEDLNLGLDLAAIGHSPIFCPSALVTSRFPNSGSGANAQRQRWEHGHIHTIIWVAPRYLMRAVLTGNANLLALILDLVVPPLSLLVILTSGMFALSAGLAIAGFQAEPLIVMSIVIASLSAAILLSWWKIGRDLLPINGAHLILFYVLGKVHIYWRLLLGRGVSKWIRADRKRAPEDAGENN